MASRQQLRTGLIAALACLSLNINAQEVSYGAEKADESENNTTLIGGEVRLNASTSSDFAPYYLSANRDGTLTQANGLAARVYLTHGMNLSERFSYGYGVDLIGQWTSATDYLRYSPEQEWQTNSQRPAWGWIQQLYGELKYRGVFLTVGAKEMNRSIIDNGLNSGDLVMSDNARPIPQIRAGFIDFQNVPLTNGWLQIQGELAYGKFTDSDWLDNHYYRYNSFVTTGSYMHYARCYFRSNPSKHFVVTVGMQHATQFGGTWTIWKEGKVLAEHKMSVKFKDVINAFLPWKGGGSGDTEGDSAYYSGNHLGSWDLKLTYTFNNGSSLEGYLQSPWEDGSGIGKQNGFDGVWGLHYHTARNISWIKDIVVEYIDFTNQSGPMHWAPADFDGTQVSAEATGGDDYYNNYMYNGWCNYGMSIGSPFVKSTIYNTDGYLRYTDNRMRGVHLGAQGNLSESVGWKMLWSYRRSWGTPLSPRIAAVSDTSMELECSWNMPYLKGLSLSGALAWDAGKLYGNNFGGLLSLRYCGKLF